jgi:chromosome segregation ATPase
VYFIFFIHLYFTIQVDEKLENISAQIEELNQKKEKLEAAVVREETKNATEEAGLRKAEANVSILQKRLKAVEKEIAQIDLKYQETMMKHFWLRNIITKRIERRFYEYSNKSSQVDHYELNILGTGTASFIILYFSSTSRLA